MSKANTSHRRFSNGQCRRSRRGLHLKLVINFGDMCVDRGVGDIALREWSVNFNIVLGITHVDTYFRRTQNQKAMCSKKIKHSFISFLSLALPLSAAVLLVACGDDDGNSGPSNPAPEVTVTAQLTTPTGQSDWSMPMGQIVITDMPEFGFSNAMFTAFNDQEQSLVISFDSLAIGQFFNQGVVQTAEEVFMTYQAVPDSFALSMSTMVGLPQGEQLPYAMITVTEINTQAKVASGTFEGMVVNPLDSADWAIFQNGEFINVPYANADELDPPTGGIDGESYVNADVNGVAFESQTAIGVGSNNPMIPTVGISSTSADGSTLGFSFQMTFAELEVTTYDIGSLGATLSASYAPQGDITEQVSSDSGTLTITSIDESTKVIEGTFEFEASPFGFGGGEDASITNGEFRVQVN